MFRSCRSVLLTITVVLGETELSLLAESTEKTNLFYDDYASFMTKNNKTSIHQVH